MRISDFVAAVAAAAVVTAVVAMPDGSGAETEQTRAREVPVEQRAVVCPPMPAAGDPRASVVTPVLDLESELSREPVRMVAGDSTLGRITGRGEVWRTSSDRAGAGFVARASGALAAGLSGVATSDLDANRASGLATAACVAPDSSWWFVGTGSSIRRDSTLVLSNATAGIAVVDLAFHGPEGLIEDVDSEQIALDSGERQELALEDFVPGVADVAVEVRVRQGRVAAAVSETAVEVTEPVGADFLGASAAPDRQVELSGLPAGRGRRTLTVVNTGETETVVEVEVLGATGAFEPTGLDVLRVPAGAVVTRNVTGVTGEEISGLRLSAEQPITASVRALGPDGEDISFVPAGPLLADGAAVPIPRGLAPTVVLSAVNDSPATADITVFNQTGEQIGQRTLEISGGTTSTWRVRGSGRPASILVTSQQGDQLTGAVRWAGEDGQSVTPLLPLQTTREQPALQYDPVGP